MSGNMLQKVITAQGLSEQSGGGALSIENSARFIDYMWDQSVLLPQVRTERMTSDVAHLNKIGIGQRVLRGASEAVDDGMNLTPRFAKISLTATKLRADWELSRDTLEDNIEGDDFEDRIVRMLTAAIAQDLEDLAINGDVDSADPLLHFLDGFGKRGKVDGVTVDAAGAGISRHLLSQMIKKMPRRFLGRRGQMKFFAGSDLVQNYVDYLGNAVAERVEDPRSVLGDDVALGAAAGYSMMGNGGIRLQDVPLMENYDAPVGENGADAPVADIWLTHPQNLVWGIRRDVEVFSRFNQKTDSIEYTVYTRVAANVEEKDAFVVAENVGVDTVEPWSTATQQG